AIEGRVLALMRLARARVAEQLAAQHAPSSPGIYRSYIGLLTERLGGQGRPVDMEVARQLAAHADRNHASGVAPAPGGAAGRAADLAAAEAWLRQSLAWRETDNAAAGLAVVLQRQGTQTALEDVPRAWASRASRIRVTQRSGGGLSPAAM